MQRPIGNNSIIPSALFFLIVGASWISVQGQSLPPARYDGFTYTNHRVDADTIMIEAFFDPLCPDSRDSWPPLKQALKHYGSRLSLVIHLLPLPYHDNAFAASRALHIVNMVNKDATFQLLEWFFQNQKRFYNAQTLNMSRAAVVDEIVKSATQALGNSFYHVLESGFNDRKTDLKTRISFKYSTSKGVFGTPFFYVNGFLLPDVGSPLDYSGWKRLIDSLLRAQGLKTEEPMHYLL